MAGRGRPVKADEARQPLTDEQLRFVIAHSPNPFVRGIYKAILVVRETEARKIEEASRKVEP